MRDWYSHSHAAIQGWAYPPNPADALFLNWVDAEAQMHTGKGKVPPQPAKRPWEEKPRARAVAAPDADQVERRNRLKERLGLNI